MLNWIIIFGSVVLVLLAIFLLSKFFKKNKSGKNHNPLKRYYPKKEKDALHPEQKTLNNFPTTSLKESDF